MTKPKIPWHAAPTASTDKFAIIKIVDETPLLRDPASDQPETAAERRFLQRVDALVASRPNAGEAIDRINTATDAAVVRAGLRKCLWSAVDGTVSMVEPVCGVTPKVKTATFKCDDERVAEMVERIRDFKPKAKAVRVRSRHLQAKRRSALFARLACDMIKDGQIVTTLPQARELRPFVEHLVDLAKKGDPAARRKATDQLGGSDQVSKLFGTYGPFCKTQKKGCVDVQVLGGSDDASCSLAVVKFADNDWGGKGIGSTAALSKDGLRHLRL